MQLLQLCRSCQHCSQTSALSTELTSHLCAVQTTLVRHGLMLVGPTMGGKTANYRTLAGALTRLADSSVSQNTNKTDKSAKNSGNFERVRVVALNPKALTMGQLYGEFDENTHEWTDGVLACYMRECSDDTTPDKKWIMFDGPVDAIWIENMNTVRVLLLLAPRHLPWSFVCDCVLRL